MALGRQYSSAVGGPTISSDDCARSARALALSIAPSHGQQSPRRPLNDSSSYTRLAGLSGAVLMRRDTNYYNLSTAMSWCGWQKRDCYASMSCGSKAPAAPPSTDWMTESGIASTTPAMTWPGETAAPDWFCLDFQSKTLLSEASNDTIFCAELRPTNSIGPLRRAKQCLSWLRAEACPQWRSSRANKRARRRAPLQKLCYPSRQPS